VNEAIPRQTEVENIARLARLNMARDHGLHQVAFLWTGDRVAIVGGRPLQTKMDKMAWATILRRMAMEFNADTVLNIMEVWAAETKATALDDRMGPVKDKTGAYEAVLFHLETKQGTWMTLAPIIRVPGQPPSFPMPRFWTQGATEGILTNLLPDKDASAYKKRD